MSRDQTMDMVREFHKAFSLHDHTNEEPCIPDLKVCLTRVQCLQEELAELSHALGKGDKVEVLDALCDLQYFLDGTFLACGMGHLKVPAVTEVHRTNMAKLDKLGRPRRDSSGRVIKPEGWVPPLLEQFL